jgi:hypothetical protein
MVWLVLENWPMRLITAPAQNNHVHTPRLHTPNIPTTHKTVNMIVNAQSIVTPYFFFRLLIDWVTGGPESLP